MRRREIIAIFGGATAWPLAARAQQTDRVRHIGILLPAAADNPEFQARLAAFHQGLAVLGWTIGRNVRIETRWATGDPVQAQDSSLTPTKTAGINAPHDPAARGTAWMRIST